MKRKWKSWRCPDYFDKWSWWENVGSALNTTSEFSGKKLLQRLFVFCVFKVLCCVDGKPELSESKATLELVTRGAHVDVNVNLLSGITTDSGVLHSYSQNMVRCHDDNSNCTCKYLILIRYEFCWICVYTAVKPVTVAPRSRKTFWDVSFK